MNFLANKLRYKYNVIFAAFSITTFCLFETFYDLISIGDTFEISNLNVWSVSKAFLFLFALSFASLRAITIVLGLIFLTTLIQTLYMQYFGTYIPPIAFEQIYSNYDEASESFSAEIASMIPPALLLIAISAVFAWLARAILPSTSKHYLPVLILIVFVIGDNAWTWERLNQEGGKIRHRDLRKILPTNYTLMYNNFQLSLQYFTFGILPKKISGDYERYPVAAAPALVKPKPNINIILFLGESLRAKQLAILGYEKNTTPLLSRRTDMTSKEIFSAGTMTKTSVSALINRMEYPGVSSQIANQENCLFKLAENNGFQTHFISTQLAKQLNIIDTLVCKKYIGNNINRSQFPSGSDPHDIAIIDQLSSIDFNKNNFIVLNQRGSHSPHANQYPKEFDHFDQPYDNTVLYTDFVLNTVLDEVKKRSSGETYIIYTSDHGELLGEHNKKGHGWFHEEVYKVPLIYVEANTTDSKADAISDLQTHYDLSNFITQLLGYDAPIDTSNERDIYVNGSDISGLAGYLRLHIKNGEVVESEIN